jgi:glutaredoxin
MAEKRKASEAYLAKLRDPRWQKMRLEVFNRDGWACGYCGDTKTTLHVHHKAYRKGAEPWDYPMDWLITACEPCHENQPRELKPEEMELIANMRNQRMTAYDIKMIADGFRDSDTSTKTVTRAGAIYLVLVHQDVLSAAIDAAKEVVKASKAARNG